MTPSIADTVDAIYRTESRRIFATLVRLLGDFDLTEEALHDALRSALEQWPRDGLPANPRAFLVPAPTVAQRIVRAKARIRDARIPYQVPALAELPERLDAQDRSLWHRGQIEEGAALVERALLSRRFGPYTLQAAIAAVHAETGSPEATDWPQITATKR